MSTNEDLNVDALINMLGGEGPSGSEKTAFSRSDMAEAASVELFTKIGSDMEADEVLKQAAHAKLSGAIISDAILEKLSASFGPSVAKMAAAAVTQAMDAKLASILPQVVAQVVPHVVQLTLEKMAIGTSSAISGNLVHAKANEGSAESVRQKQDEVGRGAKGRVESFLHTDTTEGAVVSGGNSPEGGAGVKPEAFEPIGKMSAARSKVAAFLQDVEKKKLAYLMDHVGKPAQEYLAAVKTASAYVVEQKAVASEFLKKAEIEQDLARYQELEQKSASGMLSPEEKQELEMLRNKLMAAAGGGGGGAPGGAPPSAGGGGAPGGAPAGGSQGEGMMPSGSYGDKVAMVQALLKKYNLAA